MLSQQYQCTHVNVHIGVVSAVAIVGDQATSNLGMFSGACFRPSTTEVQQDSCTSKKQSYEASNGTANRWAYNAPCIRAVGGSS